MQGCLSWIHNLIVFYWLLVVSDFGEREIRRVSKVRAHAQDTRAGDFRRAEEAEIQARLSPKFDTSRPLLIFHNPMISYKLQQWKAAFQDFSIS